MKKLIIIFSLLLVFGLTKAFAWTGSGTSSDPYQISTAADMASLATNVNAGTTYSGTYFKLMNDISLSAYSNWAPIGNSSNEFRGIFDGNSKKITGLTISGTSDYCGLFGNIGYGCSIKNLTIENCSITTTGSTVGALVGYAMLDIANQNITIDNCKSSGSITGSSNIGGLIGGANQTSSATGGDAYSIIISNSSSSVTVVSTLNGNGHAGGLIGYLQGSSPFGGGSPSMPQLKYSYATGSVSCSGASFLGGLVSVAYWVTISNCYATGSVSDADPSRTAGGLIGNINNSTISNCYSSGQVTGSGSWTHGFIGDASSNSGTNCFWDKVTSGQLNDNVGTPKTTAEMKTQSTFTGWDFTSPIWLIDASHNSNYPYLNTTPIITSFSPISGAVGTSVTITGNNFNITPENNVVFFGATRATVSAASSSSLTFTVPSGATYAPITVLNTGTTLAAYSRANFTPTFSPNKGSISTGDFAAKVDFTTGYWSGSEPYNVAIGDIDGDGKPDLIIVNSIDNTVSVLRNTSSIGSTSFAAAVPFAVYSHPTSVAIGDIDGDGKPDLIIVSNYNTSVSVLRNTSSSGSISFAAEVFFRTNDYPTSVAIGDLDGDGKPDLAVAHNANNSGINYVSVLRNTSSGIGNISFYTKVDFQTGTNSGSVAIGDIDGDGKPDLAVANTGDNSDSVLRNNSIGSISFDGKVELTGLSNPQSVAIGDIDGDGKPDLAVANYASNTASVFRNTGSSGTISFAAKVDKSTGTAPRSVAIGDMDGDGKPDLAVVNSSANSVSVLRNTGSSGNISFVDKVDFTTGNTPISIAIGDINGDGKPDLAVVNTSANSVSVLRYTYVPPTISSFTPSSGAVGTLVTISGTNLSSPTAITIGGVSAIAVSNTGTSLVAMVMPGATTGAVSVTTAGGTVTGGSNFTVTASQIPNAQQGNKLVGTDGSSNALQGFSVAISADGNTAIVGGAQDNNPQGAAWVYTRSAGIWTQQGNKLVGTGGSTDANQGNSVALSADGNTAIVGGYDDNSYQGAVWIFTRSGSTWTQQGNKLVGTGNTGAANQGKSVSLSADGNTAIVGGFGDNSAIGASWIFTRSGSTWTQQGSKLVGNDATGAAEQGISVSLSADGNTAIVGGDNDNSNQGAVWVYTRSGSTWTQQGSKLVGTGNTGAAKHGMSVSVSADGNTAIVGGYQDNSAVGAAWVYTRSGNTWTQQGSKLVGSGTIGNAFQGYSVSISADGNTAIVGGQADNSSQGAVWLYTRSGNSWTQQGSKLVGTGNTGVAQQGVSVSISADANTSIVGGQNDDGGKGAAWVYTVTPPPTISSFTPSSGAVGTLVTISGTNLSSPTTLNIGGVTAIVISNTGTSLEAMVMPGATTGAVSITTAGGTVTGGSNFTVTASQTPNAQQGNKLVGSESVGSVISQGNSVAVSADGNTAIIGGYQDNINQGAAWVYSRSGNTWTQQGSKLVGTGNDGPAYQGQSVSLSADGNTAIVGGFKDNSYQGAVWIFTRSINTWTQQGSKLVGSGSVGGAMQGSSVSISADGNTMLVGGYGDNNFQGAAWVFTRSGNTWTQQGSKLVGSGSVGDVWQGTSVAVSADGNTAIVGGSFDNSNQGAAWVYSRSSNTWTQQGSKLVGSGSVGAAWQGNSVSISADGNTAIVGGSVDNSSQGAVWIYTRSSNTWTQQGSKLVGTGGSTADQGTSVSISADGNTAIVGGHADNGNQGAAWIYTRSSNTWTQQGSKLVGTGNSGTANQGQSVSISADGNTAIVGGYYDNTLKGAAWVYTISNTWTGSTNTDWGTAGNWSFGTVPVSTDAVIIPNVSNLPIIDNSTTAALNNLTIQSSASVTDNGVLQIGGTINNSGVFTATSGTITMNGSLTQTIPASTFSTNTIKDLIINNSAGVTLGGVLAVNGTLTPTSGILTTNGSLILGSSSSGSASIAQGSGSYLSGNVNVQRYIGSSAQWRMIGFPFTQATTISESTLSGYYNTGYKAYTYDETADDQINYASSGTGVANAGWTAFTSGTTTANNGILLVGGIPNSTINFSGPVNANTTIISLTQNKNGWNLIANPYPSNINWKSVYSANSTNLDAAIYRWDPATTGYATYVAPGDLWTGNQSNIIENGAGFFVHSTGSTSITFQETDKTTTAPLASLMGVANSGIITLDGAATGGTTNTTSNQSIIKLSLQKQTDKYADEVVVRWGGGVAATDNFDGKYDAYDLGRKIGPDLSVVGNDKTVYSIFHGSELKNSIDENRIVQLGIKNMEEGTYQIGIQLISEIANGNKAYLFDSYTNQYTLIDGSTSSITFITTSDLKSQSSNRFSVVLNAKTKIDNATNYPVILLNNPSTGNLFTLYSRNNYSQLKWQIVDNGGRILQNGLLGNVQKGSTNQINSGSNLVQGSYYIKLNGDNQSLPTLKAIKN